MKIAHFLGTIRPDHDGVTRVMYQMMPHFSPEFKHEYVSPMLPEIKQPNMHMVPSVLFPFSTDYRLSMVGKKGIAKIFGTQKPDLIHIHTPCTLGRAAVKYAEANNIPFIFTFHTNFPAYLKHYHAGFLEGLIWKYLLRLQKNAKFIITPSNSIKNDLESKGFNKLVQISHGVNTGEFSPKHVSLEWKKKVGAENKTIVLFVSRLVEEKNLATLAKIPDFIKNLNQVKFVIVGDGPSRKKLETLMPHAYFTGYLKGEELLRAYASSQIFLFPSLTETFGNVTAEALASGLPCICANKGAAGDLIQENINGFLVSGVDPKEYAEKIDLLVNNPLMLQVMSINAVESTEKLAWPNVVKKYEALYRSLIKAEKTHNSETSPLL